MNCICKISDDLHCIKIHKDEPTTQPIINHIIIIDNFNLGKNLSYIQKYYFEQLSVYAHHKKINIYLITTFPKIKIININKNNIATELRKIITHSEMAVPDNEIYDSPLEETSKLVNSDTYNEIVYITNFAYDLPYKSKNVLHNISTKTNVKMHIICNKPTYVIPLQSINYYYADVHKSYEDFIKYALDLIMVIPAKLIFIELENTQLCNGNKNFVLNSNHQNAFLVDKHTNSIKINTKEIALTECENNDYDIICAIKHELSNIITSQLYTTLRNILLNYINQKENNENKNMAIFVYDTLKRKLTDIIANESKVSTSENIQMMIEYGKKSEISVGNKLISNLNNKIIKNMRFSDNLNKANEIIKDKNIVKFIEEHDENDNNEFSKSCEFFNSSITLSNWYDEIKNGSCIGLLLKLESDHIAVTCNPQWVHPVNITNTYLSVIDFIEMTTTYFKNNPDRKFGNLNAQNIVKGMAIGEANAILPIYINKHHWKIVKIYLEPLLGIVISHNPLMYSEGHKMVYFSIFNNMTIKLFSNDKAWLNAQSIKTYISYLRTCAELCFEFKFNRGIKKVISSYLANPLFRISKDCYPSDKICAETLVTGYILSDNDIKKLIIYLLEELIRINVKKINCGSDFVKYYGELNDNDREIEMNTLVTNLENSMRYYIVQLYTYYVMNKIMNNLIMSYGSYNKFIISLENNYGLINDNEIDLIIKSIKVINQSTFGFKELYNSMDMEYNKWIIEFYVLQGIKHMKFQNRKKAIMDNKYIDIMDKTIDLDFITKNLIINE